MRLFYLLMSSALWLGLIVSETCRRFSTYLEASGVTLRPWIQAFPYGTKNYSEEYILEELAALDGSTAKGWLLWSAGNQYGFALRALAQWDGSATFKEKMFRAALRLGIGG
jgi:hypothetical protein